MLILFFLIPLNVILSTVLLKRVGITIHLERKIMSAIENLQKALADVQQAARDEATRVTTALTALRANPSEAEIQAIADTLETVAMNLNAVEAAPSASTTNDASASA